MPDLKELLEQRANKVTEMRKVNDLADKEKRELTADEEKKWNDYEQDVSKLDEKIKRGERMAEIEKRDNESRREFKQDGNTDEGRKSPDIEQRAVENYERNRNKLDGLPKEEREAVESLQRSAFRSFIVNGRGSLNGLQQRALQQGVSTDGGYLVAPVAWMNDLIQGVDDAVFLRQHATKHQLTGAHSMGVPSLDTDVSDSDWTTELATGSEDSSLKFGTRELATHPLAKRIKVSKTLLRNSPGVDSIVQSRLSYKFGITQEKAFMTGNGVQRPLGVFTASADGISTSRDEAGSNTTTAIVADSLIDAKYKLKGQYWGGARWIFHRDAVKMIRKLKDGQGNYLWQPSFIAGEQDRILDLPYDMSEYAPNTFTTGLYVGLLGDFSHYWIADSLNLEVQRLTELYAESNQMGFIGRAETDGMPVLEEAFVRIQLG